VEHRGDEHRIGIQRLPALQDDPLQPAVVTLEPGHGLVPHPDAVGGQQLGQLGVERLAVGAEHQVIGEPG
jgi:hypothetical protein